MGDPQALDRVRQELLRISQDPKADLAEGALWISVLETPDLVMDDYLQWLSQTASHARANTAQLDAPGLLAVLRDELKFRGDDQNYYDARNSCLDQVIDRRRGIPITLSLIYLTLALRIGEDAAGVNAPGHFLVRHGETIVDPFRGELMSPEAFTAHLASLGIPEAPDQAHRLLEQPADHRSILVRMLINLRGIHLRARNYPKALAVVDLLNHLDPANPEWLRERGLLYRQLDCLGQSRSDLERYLSSSPDPSEAKTIRELIASMEETPRVLH
jgi:regulator of sirC expression with transglutaminase-like and TPR domain